LHVTDDVELLAHAAVGQLDPLPHLTRTESIEGVILAEACRWYAFHTETIDDHEERTEILARVVDRGRLRDFFGFNRAKHAVVEAAILATRVGILKPDAIRSEFERLAGIVDKTGGHEECRAFDFLDTYVRNALTEPPPRPEAAER
jgi:uncharacterized protein